MRWGGVALSVMLVAGSGCSRPNPFFELLSDGASGATTGTSEGTGGDAGTSTSTSTGVEETSAGSMETSGAVASTGEETSGGAGTGTSTGSSTGEGTGTSGELSTSSGEESSSGGEPEEFVAYDLWDLCPEAAWSAEGEKNVPKIECNLELANPMAPWAGRLKGGFVFDGKAEPKVVAQWPYQGANNVVTGRYTGLTLNKASSPRMRSVLVCPGPGTCEIQATVWAEIADNKVKAYQVVDLLSTGEHILFDLDLYMVNDGVPFDIVMEVKSISAAPTTRGFWLRPRILVFP